jgi:hypothetical protein
MLSEMVQFTELVYMFHLRWQLGTAQCILHLVLCACLCVSKATYSLSVKGRNVSNKRHTQKGSTYFCTLRMDPEFYGFETFKQKGANAAQIFNLKY